MRLSRVHHHCVSPKPALRIQRLSYVCGDPRGSIPDQHDLLGMPRAIEAVSRASEPADAFFVQAQPENVVGRDGQVSGWRDVKLIGVSGFEVVVARLVQTPGE